MPCQAFAAASAGDTVEIDSAGDYTGDVCAITTQNLLVRGVGAGRAHIRAGGRNAQGKGIWVVTEAAGRITVENLEFSGAAVPSRNGAGIRVDRGAAITVRDCYFHDNETGILTGDTPDQDIIVENSIFERNGAGDGQSHNIYVHRVRKFVFRGNYSARSRVGQLVKSRAAETHILYNRLSQEDGTGSREIDVSNGGRTFIIGNIIQQERTSENNNLLGYRLEGPHPLNPSEELYIINNTFVNLAPTGRFIDIQAAVTTPAVVQNNIFFGPGTLINQSGAVLRNNFVGDPRFVNLAGHDYRLGTGSSAIDAGSDPGVAGGVSLAPTRHYLHPACEAGRTLVGVIDIGAFERGGEAPADARPTRCTGLSLPQPPRVVNGASFAPDRLAPGAIASVFGANFASTLIQATAKPLPTTMDGVSVTVNELPAPLFAASQTQINFQMPPGLEPGTAEVVVRVRSERRPAATINLLRAAPGIFLYPNSNRAVAQNRDYSLNGPGNGAPPGDAVILYMTGQGALTRFIPAGMPSPAQPLAEAALPAAATIGDKPAEILFLGMTPDLVAVLQANLLVPDLPPGDHPVIVTVGGVSSNAAIITVAAI